jgi:hypothetical protein
LETLEEYQQRINKRQWVPGLPSTEELSGIEKIAKITDTINELRRRRKEIWNETGKPRLQKKPVNPEHETARAVRELGASLYRVADKLEETPPSETNSKAIIDSAKAQIAIINPFTDDTNTLDTFNALQATIESNDHSYGELAKIYGVCTKGIKKRIRKTKEETALLIAESEPLHMALHKWFVQDKRPKKALKPVIEEAA